MEPISQALAWWLFVTDTDAQSIADLSPNGYDVQNGPTTGVDTADITLTGYCGLFASDYGLIDDGLSAALSGCTGATLFAVAYCASSSSIRTFLALSEAGGLNKLNLNYNNGSLSLIARSQAADSAQTITASEANTEVHNRWALFSGRVSITDAKGDVWIDDTKVGEETGLTFGAASFSAATTASRSRLGANTSATPGSLFGGRMAVACVFGEYLSDEDFAEVREYLTDYVETNNGVLTENTVRDVMATWWNVPRAVNLGGKLYVGGCDSGGSRIAAVINTDTGLIERNVIATGDTDDHITPTMLVPQDKVPIVFYANGASDPYLRYRIGQTVQSVSDLLDEQSLTLTDHEVAYPQPYREAGTDNVTVLFYIDHGEYWYAVRSDDWGATWDTPVSLFNAGEGERVYMTTKQDGATIHCALCGHPTLSTIHEVYFCTVDLTTGDVKDAAGTTLGNIISGDSLPIAVTSLTAAYTPDTGHLTRLFDVSTEDEIVIADWTTDDDAMYRYLVRSGNTWTARDVVAAGAVFGYDADAHYHGGAAFPTPTTGGRLFLSRESTGTWIMERWTTTDGGAGWATGLIDQSDVVRLVRPFCTVDGPMVYCRVFAYSAPGSFYADACIAPEAQPPPPNMHARAKSRSLEAMSISRGSSRVDLGMK